MNDYSLTIDENLNSIDSLLNDAPAGKLSFLDSLEGTLTELMERGVFGGISNTQGIEFNVDKATNDSYIQSRNYSQYTTGWKNSSDGTLEGKTLNIGKTGNLRLKVEEDSINLYKSDGTLIGKITNDNSTHALILTAGESAGLLILKTDSKDILKRYLEVFDISNTSQEWFNKIKQVAEEFKYATDRKDFENNPNKYKGKVGDIAMTIRIAITKKTRTPDLYQIMQVLGEEKVKERLSA